MQKRQPLRQRPSPSSAPSTAWLEAQAAFSAPRPAPALAAVVTVRKGRALEARREGVAPASTECLAEPRRSRVFLVANSARSDAADGPGDASAQRLAPLAAGQAPATSRQRTRAARQSSKSSVVTIQRFAAVTKSEQAMSYLDQIEHIEELMDALTSIVNDTLRARDLRFLA